MLQIKLRSWITLAAIAIATCAQATELAPWFDPDKNLMVRPSYTYRNYTSVDTHEGAVRHHSTDDLINLSLLMANDDLYSGEIEYLIGYTSQRSFSSRALGMTLRYHLLNDVVGDPISVMAGVSLRYIQHNGLNDISFFYHGPFEFEPTLSFGKEMVCEDYWTSRWWSVFGVGTANRGSPWVRAEFSWENNWWDEQEVKIFVNSFWGLGHRNLHEFTNFEHFKGYYNIDHQSIDVGARYQYNIPCGGDISLEYYYRAYARNGPLHINAATIRLTIPFGIPAIFTYFARGIKVI